MARALTLALLAAAAGFATADAAHAQRVVLAHAAIEPANDWTVALASWFSPEVTLVHDAEPARGDIVLLAGPDATPDALARVRAANAIPVVVTLPDGPGFDGTEPRDRGADADAALRALAARERVALVDLDAKSRDLLRALGPASAPAWFAADTRAGEAAPRYNARGAHAIACLAAGALKDAGLVAAEHLVRDTACGAPPTALADRANAKHGPGFARGADIARAQAPPHGGAGTTTAYPYFADAPELGFFFRKRALHRGASIGLHPHAHDEVYYVLEGTGDYTVDGTTTRVVPGDAVLIRAGSTHSLAQAGDADLVILIVYPKH